MFEYIHVHLYEFDTISKTFIYMGQGTKKVERSPVYIYIYVYTYMIHYRNEISFLSIYLYVSIYAYYTACIYLYMYSKSYTKFKG